MIEVSKLSIATYRLLIRNLGILLHIVYCMNRDAFRDFISEQFLGNNRSVGSVHRVGSSMCRVYSISCWFSLLTG